VRQSIARIKASPFIPRKNVRGFVYDVETGGLREVTWPRGRWPSTTPMLPPRRAQLDVESAVGTSRRGPRRDRPW